MRLVLNENFRIISFVGKQNQDFDKLDDKFCETVILTQFFELGARRKTVSALDQDRGET